MIIIISDFLFNPEELERSLSLFKKSEIIVVQILDPEEVKFSITGDFMLKDSEEGHTIKTFISNRLRSNYREKLEGHIAQIKNICQSGCCCPLEPSNSLKDPISDQYLSHLASLTIMV